MDKVGEKVLGLVVWLEFLHSKSCAVVQKPSPSNFPARCSAEAGGRGGGPAL